MVWLQEKDHGAVIARCCDVDLPFVNVEDRANLNFVLGVGERHQEVTRVQIIHLQDALLITARH